MSVFVKETIEDLRLGRETWRVFVTLCTPAFAIALVVTMTLQF